MSLFKNKIDCEHGKIYSLKNPSKEIGTCKDKDGYCVCDIKDKYGNVYYYVHQVIFAEAFQFPKHLWPRDKNGMIYQINHIKEGYENRSNNAISNLELISLDDNLRYGTRDKRAAKSRINHPDMSNVVYELDSDNNIINIFPSESEAARQTGFKVSKISQCCKGSYFDKRYGKRYETKYYKGRRFIYGKDYNEKMLEEFEAP